MAVPSTPAPDECRTMREVRAGVDDLDRRVIELLGQRFAFMRAAARIKPERAMVRDTARKDAVIANAAAHARTAGAPPELIAQLWEQLVEGSIAYELNAWDTRRAG